MNHNFLNEVFPRIHMVLYNAVAGVKGFDKKAIGFLTDLKQSGESLVTEETWHGEERIMARRGLAALAKLYEKGYHNILKQYETGLANEPIISATTGIVLQLRPTSRWEKRYDTEAYDIVMAVPSWGRVIALSTTDMGLETDPSLIKRYTRMRIGNFHFYPFFNRAHGVRGRRVLQETTTEPREVDPPHDFSFLLRTCKDAAMIGKSIVLPSFTPVVTTRGLQLGFYFTILCKIKAIESVKSADGFGTNLAMTRLVISDGTSVIKVNLSTQIFFESISLPSNKVAGLSLKDPLNLATYAGWTYMLCSWLFGQEVPYVAAIYFLEDKIDIDVLLHDASMNTLQKAHASSLDVRPSTNLDVQMQRSVSVLLSDGWAYHNQEGWNARVLLTLIQKKFERLNTSDALKTGLSIAACRIEEQKIRFYFRLNPNILDLYMSGDPQAAVQSIFISDPKGETPKDNPLTDIYKCTRCKMAFHKSQFHDGEARTCTSCGFVVEPFEPEDDHAQPRNVTPRRIKASRFWGSDDWLRSLFD